VLARVLLDVSGRCRSMIVQVVALAVALSVVAPSVVLFVVAVSVSIAYLPLV
jgi:hypothetical protein